MPVNAIRDPINPVERRIEYKFGSCDPYYCTAYRDGVDYDSELPEAMVRPIPEIIGAHDRVIIENLRKRAYEIEQSTSFMGMKVGLSAGIGLIPAIGPIWNFYIGRRLIKMVDELENGLNAEQKSQLKSTLQKGFVLGLFPVLGDVFQAAYKGNTRNVMLIEEALAIKSLNGLEFS